MRFLERVFGHSDQFRQEFIRQILEEKEENPQDLFFNKFWEIYRDTVNFSAYNFFHNFLWVKISRIFLGLTSFLVSLLQSSDSKELNTKFQRFLFEFKLQIPHNNQHTI